MRIWKNSIQDDGLSPAPCPYGTPSGIPWGHTEGEGAQGMPEGATRSGVGNAQGSVHCLGNGRLCVYEQGPDLVQVFGPPYSAPALYKFSIVMEARVEVHSERQFGTAIWRHQVFVDGQPAGEMLDFVDKELPCLVRRLRLTIPLHFRLTLEKPVKMVENGANLTHSNGGLLLEAPAGTFFYHFYPFPTVIYHQIAWRGPVQAEPYLRWLQTYHLPLALSVPLRVSPMDMPEARVPRACPKGQPEAGVGMHREQATDLSAYDFTCGPGDCLLFFTGGPDYPQVKLYSESALATPYDQLLARTQQHWQAFTDEQRDFSEDLPISLPQRERLLQTIDDVAVMIKAQQSSEGGILAGYNYHMAYVRDQYGTSRGLLALGHPQEAKAVLNFYWQIWQRYGVIHNGQAAGLDGIFHIHENDEVELTGYLIQQAFDLLSYINDIDFIERIFPMLEWAWRSQVKHLVNGMLPFNGDETYIAGGMLPRSAINDGSAEATLLFITGGEKFLDWVAKNHRWSPELIADNRRSLEQAKASYRSNFLVNGRLVTNNPVRSKSALLPRFRHGVCEKCLADKSLWFIVWTERNEAGRYLCPKCLAEGPFPPAEPLVYTLPSVSLVPFYFKSQLLTWSELTPSIEDIVSRLQVKGKLPTGQDDDPVAGVSSSVGYDYGFLLNALSALKHPLSNDLYQQTLNLTDATGVWVEYYQDNQPMGTRCRPWESAINLEAILHWAITP